MQVASFNIPIFYDDVSFRFGGSSYDIPFAGFKNPKAIPFWPCDFEKLQYRPYYTPDRLLDFFGIDDNSPLPPTLNGTGRGKNLLDATRLADLHAELTPIYGYPNWLYLDLRDWIKYEMKKENDRWLASNGGGELEKLNKELEEFANNFKKNKAIVKKIQFSFTMSEDSIKKQLAEKIVFSDTLANGAKHKEYIQPSVFVSPDTKFYDTSSVEKTAIIDIPLPKKYPIDHLKYLQFTAAGDKNISILDIGAIHNKLNNDNMILQYIVLNTFPYTYYPIFVPVPDIPSSSDKYGVSIFYDFEPQIFSFPEYPALKYPVKKKTLETEKEQEQEQEEPSVKTKTTFSPSPAVPFILLVLFVVLLIVFQKSSQ